MIQLIEVAPRDGLQNEAAIIPTAVKVAFIDALSKSGVSEIEVSAFVSPKWVPQLADAEQVFAQIKRNAAITYSALVPNEQGLERAQKAKVDKIAVFTAASDVFNQHNVNTDINGTFNRFAPVIREAKKAGLKIRGYVSTAFWCPYAGKISIARATSVIRRLADCGVDEIAVGDTIGKASVNEVQELLSEVLKHVVATKLAMHFHDTFGRATDNILAAFAMGIERFDASTGGIGGCPYAPSAAGNVAMELVVAALRKHNALLSMDEHALAEARKMVTPHLQQSERSRRDRSPT